MKDQSDNIYLEYGFKLLIVAIIVFAFYELFKSFGKGLKGAADSAGQTVYGKTNQTIPQGDWKYNGQILQSGNKGWADLQNLPETQNPLDAGFSALSSIQSAASAVASAKSLNDELSAFWSLPLITHHGDNVISILQNIPTKSQIWEVSQQYLTKYNTPLADDIARNLVDDAKDAIAKVIMIKPD